MPALVSYTRDGGGAAGVGVQVGDAVHATAYGTMAELIAAGPSAWAALSESALGDVVADARLAAPLARPGKMLFCGVNYRGHLDENPAAVLPKVPFFFSKFASAIVGPEAPIVLPTADGQVDYEVELAVVIGRTMRSVAPEAALDHVFGYTIANDVSARDVQFVDMQITLGKNPDTFCPLGPAIVTPDTFGDPQATALRTRVNGEERQSDTTDNMLFRVADLLAFVSSTITLDPGDIVTTGTPAGVGTFRDPPLWLAPGDVVEVEVDGIGTLRNPVVAGW